jgi:hypothetical protein
MSKKNGSVTKKAASAASPTKAVVVDRWVGVTEHWSEVPQEHDFPAAALYLSLVCEPTEVRRLVAALKLAPSVRHQAKDLLRASGLALLPVDNAHVASDLAKIRRGERLSPVLLARGDFRRGMPLTIADGYHRVCASYHVNEDADIPCLLVDHKGAAPVPGFRLGSAAAAGSPGAGSPGAGPPGAGPAGAGDAAPPGAAPHDAASPGDGSGGPVSGSDSSGTGTGDTSSRPVA